MNVYGKIQASGQVVIKLKVLADCQENTWHKLQRAFCPRRFLHQEIEALKEENETKGYKKYTKLIQKILPLADSYL